jgi:putative CocE/NonD family hydrolase
MKALLYVVLLISPGFAYTQSLDDSTWFAQNYTKRETYISMRDGVRLYTIIYLPNDRSEKHPMLLLRTPYSAGPYGEGAYRTFWKMQYRKYLRANYIFVLQDVRGKYMSEGAYEDIRPFDPNKKAATDIDEASDTYDTVDWLVKNIENNNGKVGAIGISYPGFYAMHAALSGHPALVAASPQAPVTEWFIGDDWHHNGAFMQLDAFNFYVMAGFGSPRPAPTKEAFNKGYQPPMKDKYDFFLQQGTLNNLTKLAGDSIDFWKTLMEHPNYDTFWRRRDVRNAMRNVKPAMLVVGGLFDAEDLFGAWQTYKTIEKQNPGASNRIVMGPWSHGQWVSNNAAKLGHVRFGSNTSDWYVDSVEFPFFEYYLKGKGDANKISEATVFFTGENTWKQLEKWPLENIKHQMLYLQPGSSLSWSKSATGRSYSQYTSDPANPVPYAEGILENRTVEYMLDDQRFASRRPDVLVFQTDTLKEDLTVAGELAADLLVSTTGTDADFVVKLVDVFPDHYTYGSDQEHIMGGYQMLVRGEIFRGKYRNSFEKPEPFVPGSITKVKFQLPDVAHTFKKGHRIMVQIQSSWFPLVDRNPQKFVDIYKAEEKDFRKADIRVYHDKANASGILLPVWQK